MAMLLPNYDQLMCHSDVTHYTNFRMTILKLEILKITTKSRVQIQITTVIIHELLQSE